MDYEEYLKSRQMTKLSPTSRTTNRPHTKHHWLSAARRSTHRVSSVTEASRSTPDISSYLSNKSDLEPDEADLYVKEFIKVEAIISPKIRKQFLIPINIPCGESTTTTSAPIRRSKSEPSSFHSDKDNIGKIKLRNIAELQQPPAEGENLIAQPILNIPPPCFCYNCIPSYHNKYIPAAPRPELLHHSHIVRPPQVWRPF